MKSSRFATFAAGAALAGGVAGEYLFRARTGANVFLWIALVAAISFWAARREAVPLRGEGRLLLLPLALLAAAFAWRNSRMLLALDFLVLAFTASLAAITIRRGRLRDRDVIHCLLGGAAGALNVLLGPILLLVSDVSQRDVPGSPRSRRVAAVTRGLLLALPFLLLFTVLLATADAVFRHFITGLLSFDLATLFEHLVPILGFGWLAAGVVRTVAHADEPGWSGLQESVSSISLGSVEVGCVLGSLDLLFLAFVIIQARYLFGGGTLVESVAGLTYAEYARRGFFELVAVVALVLPLLLAVHWLVRDDDRGALPWIRGLMGTQVALMFVIMCSALFRMRLYQLEFGQTELRFYVTAFIIWLAAIFAWFALTVLRGSGRRFICGALVAGYLALLVLHIINPDALIARANLAHFAETGRYDVHYNASLSADAVPALIEAVPELPPDEAGALARRLLAWCDRPRPDWREWNWGRHRARRAAGESRDLLEETAGAPTTVSGDRDGTVAAEHRVSSPVDGEDARCTFSGSQWSLSSAPPWP